MFNMDLLPAMAALLATQNIVCVVASFSGSGDEGNYDSFALIRPGMGDLAGAERSALLDSEVGWTSSKLEWLLEDLFNTATESFDWCNNDGGCGVAFFLPAGIDAVPVEDRGTIQGDYGQNLAEVLDDNDGVAPPLTVLVDGYQYELTSQSVGKLSFGPQARG